MQLRDSGTYRSPFFIPCMVPKATKGRSESPLIASAEAKYNEK